MAWVLAGANRGGGTFKRSKKQPSRNDTNPALSVRYRPRRHNPIASNPRSSGRVKWQKAVPHSRNGYSAMPPLNLPKPVVRYALRVKSLGAGLAAGVARNNKVMQHRLKQFKSRLPRYRMLRQAGVDTAMLVRTGGVAALMHGYMAIGVAPSMLLQQRRTASAAAAPSSGLGGQELDLSLALADGSLKGKAGPAFVAHSDVLLHWATAVWNKWVPYHKLQAALDDAKRRIASSQQPWRVVYGPAAALVCTAGRLNWEVISATELRTDKGRILNLTLDPPIVIARQSDEAV